VRASDIVAAASFRLAGQTLSIGDDLFIIHDAEKLDFAKYKVAFFAAGEEVSKIWVPEAIKRDCYAIDNSSYFRLNDDVPLIIPEVNFSDIKNYRNSKLISNPNCSTIQMLMAIKPLHDAFTLKEIVASTYQSVSGAGHQGAKELSSQVSDILSNRPIVDSHFKKQIAFNVIPQIDAITDFLYSKEELKMMNETKKILNLPDIDITATCVRVPVFVGHSISVFAKFDSIVNLDEVEMAFSNFPGIKVIKDNEKLNYKTPIDAAGRDEVFISRIRKHPSNQNALSFWCVADNLRKGAALNAVQIAMKLLEVSV
jgi:aspartate-semialdehyde dehydrogenase